MWFQSAAGLGSCAVVFTCRWAVSASPLSVSSPKAASLFSVFFFFVGAGSIPKTVAKHSPPAACQVLQPLEPGAGLPGGAAAALPVLCPGACLCVHWHRAALLLNVILALPGHSRPVSMVLWLCPSCSLLCSCSEQWHVAVAFKHVLSPPRLHDVRQHLRASQSRGESGPLCCTLS